VAEWREACDLVGWRELGRGLNTIWGIEASALAPGTLPPVRISAPVYDVATWIVLIGQFVLFAGCCAQSLVLFVVGASIFAASYALTWIAGRWMLPARVEFGRLRTFRDLAGALASEAVGFGPPHNPEPKG
jgi:hypothetical protein